MIFNYYKIQEYALPSFFHYLPLTCYCLPLTTHHAHVNTLDFDAYGNENWSALYESDVAHESKMDVLIVSDPYKKLFEVS